MSNLVEKLNELYECEQGDPDFVIDRCIGDVKPIPVQNRLVVALDYSTADDARRLIDRLGDAVSFYKIGLELLFGGGLKLAEDLKSIGKLVLLDMKLLDIGNTIEKSVANIANLGVDFVTVHGVDRKTMDAAVRGRGNSDLKLLAVTVLTNLTDKDLLEQGTIAQPGELAIRRAKLANECGFDGVIASGQEAREIRGATSKKFIIKCPGIRPTGSLVGDQSRVMTPADAIKAGADYLVVGRPITEHIDPVGAALMIQREIKDQVRDQVEDQVQQEINK